MKALVLGGGIIGVTTAYYLAKAGHEAVVLERNDGLGLETSFQNGALLAPGHSQSWAAPGALWTLVKSVFQKDPALRFRLSADPAFWRWGLRFLGQCTEAHHVANTLRVFRCMNAGVERLRELRAETGIEYDGNDRGILYLFRSQESLESRAGDWTVLRDHGLRLEAVDREACVRIEPVLEAVKDTVAGGFFSPDEAAGDAFVFTRNLARMCETMGVELRFATTVTGLQTNGDAIEAVRTDRGEMKADRYLLALGPYSPILGRRIGLDLPIWPVKGYTASIPIDGHNGAPAVGVIEEDNLVAFANLGDRLRIGGKADFAGYDAEFRPRDFAGVFEVAKALFPDGGDYSRATYWACLRPVTPGGPPILGRSPYRNLYLNVGHGAAGWTMACATCQAVADIMCDRRPELDMEGLTYPGVA